MSGFGSGLEHLWDALLHEYDPRTRKSVLALSFRCLALQTLLNTIAYLAPDNACANFNKLFFPTVLLFRYLYPDPWDQLFMNTVRSLNCADRSDVVAKPGPLYFTQLRQYIRRTFKAYFAIGIVHLLVHRTGVFSLPSMGLGLIIVHQFLLYKGFHHAILKLCLAVMFLGPTWPVSAVQAFALQQMFMYELLQPYLIRAQFKGWEERAWLELHAVELQGFAFGAWLLCSIPWVGVAAIPFMFPAVAFLLTRSCGLMESSGQGVSGDVIENRSPGVKTVAKGNSKSIQGDWYSSTVKTFVRTSNQRPSPPVSHAPSDSTNYICEQSTVARLSTEQVENDRRLNIQRKRELHRASRYSEEHRNATSRSSQGRPDASSIPSWDSPRPPAPFMHSTDNFSNRFPRATRVSPSAPPAPAEIARNNSSEQESLIHYNFSDRKTDETAPSAPPTSVLNESTYWAEDGASAFRVESATAPEETAGNEGVAERRRLSHNSEPRTLLEKNDRHMDQAYVRSQDERNLAREANARAKGQRTRAREQRGRVSEQNASAREQLYAAREQNMRAGTDKVAYQEEKGSEGGSRGRIPNYDAEIQYQEQDDDDEDYEDGDMDEVGSERWKESLEDCEDDRGVRDDRQIINAGLWGSQDNWARDSGGWDETAHERARGGRGRGRGPHRGWRRGRGSRGGPSRPGQTANGPSERGRNNSSRVAIEAYTNGLSAAIAESMLNVEENINERMENWGRKWAQKLSDKA
ncbi:hypothetical protein BG004_005759 [Podila humilis]|nr:hypothetical protein BG004_005759 [Podila humilis]